MVPYLVRIPDTGEGDSDDDREDDRLKRRSEVLARADPVGTESLLEEQLHNVGTQHHLTQGRRVWAAGGLGCSVWVHW